MLLTILRMLMLVGLLVGGCGRTMSGVTQRSPDGTMVLTTSINHSKGNPTRYLCVIVDIVDSAGKSLYHEATPASDTQRWSIQWVSNDDVLLKSSDVGDYHLRRLPDGTWKGKNVADGR